MKIQRKERYRVLIQILCFCLSDLYRMAIYMKTSVTSYSFHKLCSKGELDDMKLIAVAKEMGFDGVEFAELHPPEGVDKKAFAKDIADECKAQGIACVSYTIGADFINGCDGDLEAEIKRLCDEVEVAKILGVPAMRHDAAWGYRDERGRFCGFETAFPRLVEGCRRVTEYAKTRGIRTMTENHGFFCQESQRVERLINAVGDPNFGALVDVGNFMCADEDPASAVGRMAPYAFHVHVKDFYKKSGNLLSPCGGHFCSRGGYYLKGTIVGHGDVPVVQCLSILKNAGYEGYVTVEFEGMEDCYEGIQSGLDYIKKVFSII